jgi:hypothetical protein
MDMRPPDDNEMDTLPHILLTGNDLWNSSCIDDEFFITDLCLDAPADNGDQDPHVNNIGEYTGNIDEDINLIIHQCRTKRQEREDYGAMPNLLECCINQHTVSKASKPNLEALGPNFGWLPIKHIKKTIQATSQFSHTAPCYPFRKHYHAHWPAANVNVNRWNASITKNLRLTVAYLLSSPVRNYYHCGFSFCRSWIVGRPCYYGQDARHFMLGWKIIESLLGSITKLSHSTCVYILSSPILGTTLTVAFHSIDSRWLVILKKVDMPHLFTEFQKIMYC